MQRTKIEWKTQPIECNLCRGNDTSLLWQKDRFSYVRCNQCGLVYVNPQLLPTVIDRIYEIGFVSKSASKPAPADFSVYQSILRWAAPYRRNARLLEIGCFKGYLLVAAREQGWSVFGTDISAQAVGYTRQQYGLDVFLGSLTDAGYPDGQFDVVIMQDVLEHLSDPRRYLEETYRILRVGGGLYVETPNFDSITRWILGKDWAVFFPWHQYYFTARTLRRALETTGFVVHQIRCVGLAPISRYNALRGLEERQEIAPAYRGRLKSFIEMRVLFLKAFLLLLLSIVNSPFHLLSAIGIHLGTKMIVFAEKPP